MKNNILEMIKQRRSIRKFQDKDVPDELLVQVLEAGIWAPSGLNNQPWRFVVIRNSDIREGLAGLTHYGRIVKACNICIAVYYHIPSGYDRDKDILGIGACIENMLLAVSSMGLGAVWLGEILKRKEEVNSLLGIDSDHELMAVIAIGYPDETPRSERKALEELIIKRI